jgi:exodeoxyribonuclease V
MQFSPQQDAALKAIAAWLKQKDAKQVFYLAGYAGVGKTVLARHIAQAVSGTVLFAAFTGKAAMVMRSKGCDGASTIHSLIYKVKEVRPGVVEYHLDEDSSVGRAALTIIDECSMVSIDLARDLLSFGTKVLVLGDPAQLKPVDGAGYFTRNEPDFFLTEIHRQARDNPIIRMSVIVREGGELACGSYGESRVVRVMDDIDPTKFDQVLVGRNQTRNTYNARMRELLGHSNALFDTDPRPGEKLVCLRNRREKGLLNGSLWKIIESKRNTRSKYPGFKMVVFPLDEGMGDQNRETWTPVEFFSGRENELDWEARKGAEEFTYGYCLTVHKAQGSQWNNVFVRDESYVFREDAARHLYTALTRAAERITILR